MRSWAEPPNEGTGNRAVAASRTPFPPEEKAGGEDTAAVDVRPREALVYGDMRVGAPVLLVTASPGRRRRCCGPDRFGSRWASVLAKTRPGVFEQRLEIYTPPYLRLAAHTDRRPENRQPGRNGNLLHQIRVGHQDGATDPPSSTTHVTDVEQRSIALAFKKTKDGKGIQVTVPKNRDLVPAGWYMLFVTDDQGTPSKALWVRVP